MSKNRRRISSVREKKKKKRRIKVRLYISLIEQIQFSFVVSKSYTQLPAEECYEHSGASVERRKSDSKDYS